MFVVAGSASFALAERIGEELNCRTIKPERRRFPDGELYLRIPENVDGEHVIIVQSTPSPQNDNFMELFLLLDATKEQKAEKVSSVVPYFAYARQDKRFSVGEVLSMKTMQKLIESTDVDEFLTVDIHEEATMEFFTIPARSLSAMYLIGEFLPSLDLKSPALLAPDQGALKYVKQAAESFEADYDYLVKKRKTPTEVHIEPRELNVKGRDVVILDDIISTGGTIIEAAKLLNEQGARKVYAGCTHAVLANNVLEKIRKAGVEKVFATDTIEAKISEVSVAPLIARAVSG